jgi:hypothetical protein
MFRIKTNTDDPVMAEALCDAHVLVLQASETVDKPLEPFLRLLADMLLQMADQLAVEPPSVTQ